MHHTPLLRLTQVLAALAVVSAGCGGEAPEIKSNPKETQPHRVLRIVGGAAAQRTLLRGIMNRETTPDPPKAGSSDVEALGEKLADEASEADATLRASEVFAPYGAAASVRLEVRDPPEFLRRRLSRFLDAFENGSYEGLYVEATTPDGSIVWKGAFASRLGAGSSWVRPDLAGCYLGTFSLERDTPPCPAR